MTTPKVFPTYTSEAFWCDPKTGKFASAQIRGMKSYRHEAGTPHRHSVCWLDELLQGGIVVPSMGQSGRALTILISGPPGTGKSTLATELCYRWSQAAATKLTSTYLSTEAPAEWLIQNLKRYNWKHSNTTFTTDLTETDRVRVLTVKDKSELSVQLGPATSVDKVSKFLGLDPSTLTPRNSGQLSDVLVLDSLNTIPAAEQTKLFQDFLGLAYAGYKILILILDSGRRGATSEFWDFASDIVVRLGRDYDSGYMVRTIEIVKARFQAHVWGVHQLKIYEPFRDVGIQDPDGQDEAEKEASAKATLSRRLRAHPFRREGGIFVFPSIHYVLSVYKRQTDSRLPPPIKSPLPALTDVLEGGFPSGRCIGFVGRRGGHKSHLGYLQILEQLRNDESQKAIVISLRDDEGLTRRAMDGILKEQWSFGTHPTTGILDEYIESSRLEITYFPPGFITPEEFFNRLLLSICRLKGDDPNTPVTLLFNSLDQLPSRFPLCAREDIFVPGIIQMLSAEGVTSFFIAAEDPGKPAEYHGLLTMAEVIINFQKRNIASKRYHRLVRDLYRGSKPEIAAKHFAKATRNQIEVVEACVERFAGGQAAGAKGILELVTEEGKKATLSQEESEWNKRAAALRELYGAKRGLHFIPFVRE